ncbi:hypothetical protein CMI42_05850 [Candidatus Pacearchaeota archaeon]|nr:hypothetical protein [Candidatus Pacearchaeota archaeon]
MDGRLYDWFVVMISFLVYIHIFIKTIGTTCFSTSDLNVTLVGITASVWLLTVRVIRRKR